MINDQVPLRYQYLTLIEKELNLFILKRQNEFVQSLLQISTVMSVLASTWKSHLSRTVEQLRNRCLEAISNVDLCGSFQTFENLSSSSVTENLFLISVGAISFLNQAELKNFWQNQLINRNFMILTICSFLLSPDHYGYIRAAIPVHLNFRSDVLSEKEELLRKVLKKNRQGKFKNFKV